MVDFPQIARQVINQIGYDQPEFNGKTCSIVTSLKELPEDRSFCFNEQELSDKEIDRIQVKNQVTVFGFACNQTAALMPLPIWLAHKLARKLTAVRLQKALPYIAPDGKTQVGVEYRDRMPHRIQSITVIASQRNQSDADMKKLSADIRDAVIDPVFADEAVRPDEKTLIFVNPDGPFVTGGPSIHSGLTGRKNAIDTYGEYSRHSGAALSGKDPMRIDRVGAYAARYAAKNIIAAGIAEACEVQLSYSLGLARPVSVQVETFGTGRIADDRIAGLAERHFDFRLAAIMRQFNLRYLPSTIKGGFYRKLASYGHVGRMDIGLPWELTDSAGILRDEVFGGNT